MVFPKKLCICNKIAILDIVHLLIKMTSRQELIHAYQNLFQKIALFLTIGQEYFFVAFRSTAFVISLISSCSIFLLGVFIRIYEYVYQISSFILDTHSRKCITFSKFQKKLHFSLYKSRYPPLYI